MDNQIKESTRPNIIICPNCSGLQYSVEEDNIYTCINCNRSDELIEPKLKEQYKEEINI